MTLDSYSLRKVEENKARFPVGSTCYIQNENSKLVQVVVSVHLKETIKVECKNFLGETITRSFKAHNVSEIGRGGSRIYSAPRLVTFAHAEDAKAFEVVRKIEDNMRRFSEVVAECLRNTKVDDQAEALRELANEFDALKVELAAAQARRKETQAVYLASK